MSGGEDLGDVSGLDGDILAFYSARHLHEAPGIIGDEGVGARLTDAVELALENGARYVRILNRKGASEPAALLGIGEVLDFYSLHIT